MGFVSGAFGKRCGRCKRAGVVGCGRGWGEEEGDETAVVVVVACGVVVGGDGMLLLDRDDGRRVLGTGAGVVLCGWCGWCGWCG